MKLKPRLGIAIDFAALRLQNCIVIIIGHGFDGPLPLPLPLSLPLSLPLLLRLLLLLIGNMAIKAGHIVRYPSRLGDQASQFICGSRNIVLNIP
ncbi:hypothetical protein ACLKA7_003888 [Drosophila subpalustris]